MTPMQRRRQNAAMSEVAVATHKRYLGRPELLTGIQSAWIKSLLTVWGKASEEPLSPASLQRIRAGGPSKGSDGQTKHLSVSLLRLNRQGVRGFAGLMP